MGRDVEGWSNGVVDVQGGLKQSWYQRACDEDPRTGFTANAEVMIPWSIECVVISTEQTALTERRGHLQTAALNTKHLRHPVKNKNKNRKKRKRSFLEATTHTHVIGSGL